MGVWHGVAIDSLKFHPGMPYLTLLRPAGGPPLEQPYGHFRGGRHLPLWTPYALRLWFIPYIVFLVAILMPLHSAR
jgi:hypothetical protein